MLDLDVARLFAAKGGRPLGVLVALSAIFLPSSLLVYFTRPDLYERFGIGGGIFFGAAVGLPVVIACSWPWQALLWAGVKREEMDSRIAEAGVTLEPHREPTLLEKVTAEDPLEWPILLTGGWTANLVLYCLVAIAYYRPLMLGATLLLTVGLVLAFWFVLAVVLAVAVRRYERKANEMIAHNQELAQRIRSASPPR